jgi:hypothetical protein
MAFIVQAYPAESDCLGSITIERREDALETALLLSEQGRTAVRIIGDGRIYNPAEFSLTVGFQEFLFTSKDTFLSDPAGP